MNEIERDLHRHYEPEHQLEQNIADRRLQVGENDVNPALIRVLIVLQEALQESQRQSERTHQESINQIIRERDAICEEKLAAQKRFVVPFLQILPFFFSSVSINVYSTIKLDNLRTINQLHPRSL